MGARSFSGAGPGRGPRRGAGLPGLSPRPDPRPRLARAPRSHALHATRARAPRSSSPRTTSPSPTTSRAAPSGRPTGRSRRRSRRWRRGSSASARRSAGWRRGSAPARGRGSSTTGSSPSSRVVPDRARARRSPQRGPLLAAVTELQPPKGVPTLIEAMPRVLEQRPDANLAGRRRRADARGDRGSDRCARGRRERPPARPARRRHRAARRGRRLRLAELVGVVSLRDPRGDGRRACRSSPTDVGGVGEAIEDGVTGWLVAPQDAAALAQGLIEALAEDGRRAPTGALPPGSGSGARFTFERDARRHARGLRRGRGRDDPPRVAHVITGLEIGGAEVLLARLLERVDRRGVRAPHGDLADRPRSRSPSAIEAAGITGRRARAAPRCPARSGSRRLAPGDPRAPSPTWSRPGSCTRTSSAASRRAAGRRAPVGWGVHMTGRSTPQRFGRRAALTCSARGAAVARRPGADRRLLVERGCERWRTSATRAETDRDDPERLRRRGVSPRRRRPRRACAQELGIGARASSSSATSRAFTR